MQNNQRRRRPLTEEQKRRIREKKKKEARTIRILTILLCVIVVAIVAVIAISCSRNKKKKEEQVQPIESMVETVTEPEKSTVELVAVGDVLMHTPLMNYARNDDGSFDFNSIFDVMRDDISRADIAVCNQETPVKVK